MRRVFVVLAMGLLACGSSPAAVVDAGARPPGNTDTDCGGDHTACNPGQSCASFGTGSNVHFGCACTRGNPAVTDSCAANTNGKVVCEATTLDCRMPRDEEPCGVTADCDTGYTCARELDEFYADGGVVLQCIFRCAQTSDCPLDTTSCVQSFYEFFADGGEQVSGACHFNYCGPESPLRDGGTANIGAYFSACPGDAATDGTCAPFQVAGDKTRGVCHRPGSGHAGGPCHVNAADGTPCAHGLVCILHNDPAQPATCEFPCDASATGTATHCPANRSCVAYVNDFESTRPQPGACN